MKEKKDDFSCPLILERERRTLEKRAEGAVCENETLDMVCSIGW